MANPQIMDLTGGRPESQGGYGARGPDSGHGKHAPLESTQHPDAQHEREQLATQITHAEAELGRKRARLQQLHARQ